MHEFELADGRRIGFPDPETPDVQDETKIIVASVLGEGDEFVYVFDFGDDWRHHCRVLDDKVDPYEVFGDERPETPVPIWGWGSMPDQYGRDVPDDVED